MKLVPAYGRDYKSARDVKSAWLGEKDFMIQDFFSPYDGKVTNITDCQRDGIREVYIRYQRLTKVARIKF